MDIGTSSPWPSFLDRMYNTKEKIEEYCAELCGEKVTADVHPVKMDHDEIPYYSIPTAHLTKIMGSGEFIELLNLVIGTPEEPLIGSPEEIYEKVFSGIKQVREVTG